MTTRKIIRTSDPKVKAKKDEQERHLNEAFAGLQAMNEKLMQINAGLKHNTNQMVEEIGRCLDNLFTRMAQVEAHCGIVLPGPADEIQTTDAPTEETATSTDTPTTLNIVESPSPEEQLAQ